MSRGDIFMLSSVDERTPILRRNTRALSFDNEDQGCTNIWKKLASLRGAFDPQHFNKDNLYLGFSVFLLLIGTATERVTFKMTVDRMLPYKFVVFELIFLISCSVFSIITVYKLKFTNEIDNQMRNFPQSKIFIIAIMDTIQFIFMAFAAARVTPTMTVLMMHVSTPVVVFVGSKCVFPGRRYSSVHVFGVYLILLALFLGMVRPVVADIQDKTFYRTYNSILYASSAALQGLVTLFKEKTIIDWSYPINIYYISSYLFFYQFLITVFISLCYYLKGEMGAGGNYMVAVQNIYDGWTCFLGQNPYTESKHTHPIDCSASVWLLFGFVFSNLLVLVCINNMLELNYRTVGRATGFAILTAFLVLWVYDVSDHTSGGHLLLGSNVGVCDLVSIIVLLVGLEIYGREAEPDVELITNFSPGIYKDTESASTSIS